MRRKIEFVMLILLLAGLLAASRNLGRYVSSSKVRKAENTVVIDAGHGSGNLRKVTKGK